MAPETGPVPAYLARLHDLYDALDEGEIATYIPELSQANRDWFGVALATTDGAVYETGDSREPFTIQSVSKPFVYGLALELYGEETVRRCVGIEPSGDAFNSIRLAPDTGAPPNPMVNAGAIAMTGLIAAHESEPHKAIREVLSRAAGRPLEVDPDVHRSEAMTGFRNRAIVNLLRNFDIVAGDPDTVADLYFEQCSVLVDCRDLALMAATLANGGVHPESGERVFSEPVVRAVLSVMTSCGMYDSAGEWLHAVGLPAKSGVSGGIIAPVPGRLGLGVFSPLVDTSGNSVRGVAVCSHLSRELTLHVVDRSSSALMPIRSVYSVADVASRRLRGVAERHALRLHGELSVVIELQGELDFVAVEQLARTLMTDAREPRDPLEHALVDLGRVERANAAAAPLFADLVRALEARATTLDLVGAQRHPAFVVALLAELNADATRAPLLFQDPDAALEHVENLVLQRAGTAPRARVPLAEHELLRGLDDQQLAQVEALLEPRSYAAGERVLREGDAAAEILLVTDGELSVAVGAPETGRRRLATVSGGMVLGELSVITREGRSADVWADTDAECQVFSLAKFDALTTSNPELKCRLLENLLGQVSQLARRLDRELGALRAPIAF